jgi:hypothetical protein
MDRTEDMGTWRAAAFFFIVIWTYLALLAGVLLLVSARLVGVHWALAIPIFGVTAIGFTAVFWFGLKQLVRVSRPPSEKWLRVLAPLLIPYLAWMMVIAFRFGGVFGLVFGALVSLPLIDLVTNVVFRLTLHRELSATLIIGRLVRAVWRKATEKVGV